MELAFNIQSSIHKNTLRHTAFSAILLRMLSNLKRMLMANVILSLNAERRKYLDYAIVYLNQNGSIAKLK